MRLSLRGGQSADDCSLCLLLTSVVALVIVEHVLWCIVALSRLDPDAGRGFPRRQLTTSLRNAILICLPASVIKNDLDPGCY